MGRLPCTLQLVNTSDSLYEGKLIVTPDFQTRHKKYIIQLAGRYYPSKRLLIMRQKPDDIYRLYLTDCTPQVEFRLQPSPEAPQLNGYTAGINNCTEIWGFELKQELTKETMPAYVAYISNLESIQKESEQNEKEDLANRIIQYLSCNSGIDFNKYLRLYPGRSCTDLTITVVNNKDTIAYENIAVSYSVKDRSFSLQNTLCKVDNNIYDSRFLGTWYTPGYHVIYKIVASDNVGYGPFIIKMYRYNPTQQQYLEVQGSGIALSATNIDKKLYFEYVLKADLGGEGVRYRVPLHYEVINERQMQINPVSFNYKLPVFTYSSRYDYRKYFSENSSKPGFFANPIELTRLNPDSLGNISASPEIINALQLLGQNLVQGRGVRNPFNDPEKTLLGLYSNWKSNQGKIKGYDKYWNPVYENGLETGAALSYDANGNE
jgi:hypothetical protein